MINLINQQMNRSKQLALLLQLLYIFFFASMVCCFRAISSISIGLILLTGVFKNKADTGSWKIVHSNNRFLLTCCLFYLVQLAVLLYMANFNDSARRLQMQTAVFIVPLAICWTDYINVSVWWQLMKYYVWVLFSFLLFCLLFACYRYFVLHAQGDVFFYHELVIPFSQHAVQVSIMVLFGLVYLLQLLKKERFFYNRQVHLLLIFYFACCLLLLSSKLVITFLVVIVAYYFFRLLKLKQQANAGVFASLLVALAVIGLALSTQNRISRRFNEILSGNINLVQQADFSPAVYFNGLQFRLLQWRFVHEILTEQHAWAAGVSDNAQKFLNEKYISTHMYTGGANTATRGYLGYNTHNQFLQSLLQSGIPGLVSFILICWAMIGLAVRRRNNELTIMVVLLIAYCFNEAVFETQYGIMLFTFLPLILYYGADE